MAVGATPLLGGKSYVAVGRETTLGTYVTCTAALDALSAGVITQQDTKILQQIERSRTLSKRIAMGKTVGGGLEYYYVPFNTACGFLMQNAFGGTVTSATTTGESVGGLGFDHTFETGCMDQSYPSICLNIRKGPTAGQVFEYSGIRVNSMNFAAALDEPLMISTELVGMDSSTGGTDVESALTVSSADILSFVKGRFSVESTFASLTSTSFWHVESFNFTINNNLKNDASARRIGSSVLTTLPPGLQTYELSATIRFDTTTAFDAMIAETELACQIEFLGNATITSSVAFPGLKLNFQKVGIKDAGDPTISGPDEILKSTVTFDVLRDESASGYAVQAVLTSDISSFT